MNPTTVAGRFFGVFFGFQFPQGPFIGLPFGILILRSKELFEGSFSVVLRRKKIWRDSKEKGKGSVAEAVRL